MSQIPARLGANLVSVRKGEASPTTPMVAPLETPQEPPSSSMASQASTAASGPLPSQSSAAPFRPIRSPPKVVTRVSVSARLPPEMQEWIRVEAFTRSMPIQNLLEEIVAFYQVQYPLWRSQQGNREDDEAR